MIVLNVLKIEKRKQDYVLQAQDIVKIMNNLPVLVMIYVRLVKKKDHV